MYRTRTHVTPAEPEGKVTIQSFNSDVGPTSSVSDWFHPEMQLFARPAFVDREEISTDQRGARSFDTWNSFEHYVLLKELPRLPMPIKFATGSFVTQWPDWTRNYHQMVVYDNPVWGARGFGLDTMSAFSGEVSMRDNADGGLIKDPDALGELLEHGFNAIIPEIRTKVSLLNFIWELQDASSIRESVRNFVLTLRAKGLHLGSRTLADLWLQASFNVLPFVSDVQKMYSALSSAKERVKKFLDEEGKVRTHHWSYTWREYESREQTSAPYYIGYYPNVLGQCFSTSNILAKPSKFHMQIEYRFNLSDYQREHAYMLSLLDMFGINYNPAIVWNAMRWSFLVDWVLGVSQYLDSLRVSHMQPSVSIRRALWSVKRERYQSTSFTPSVNLDTQPTLEHSVATPGMSYSESAYKRMPITVPLSALTTRGLTLRQISLAAALVNTRVKRNPKHWRLPKNKVLVVF